MSDEVFTDKWGSAHIWQDGLKRRSREGVFAICIHKNRILLTWPHHTPDIAELPGGGIDEGESAEQAMIREIYEEAGVQIELTRVYEKMHTQHVRFYADYDEEHWDYSQTYFKLSAQDAAAIYFEGENDPDDALKAAWVDLDALDNMKIHAVHAKVLEEIMI